MAKCFGPEFLIYEGRRHPRIPNTDLMLMSRALEINGKRQSFEKPSSIVTEYDVPAEAWFFRDNAYPHIPYSVWMEISLQPCGFLSAYLGTNLLFPEINYYFRNLDGATKLLSDADLRGKTIRCQATLLSTIISGTTVIQKFSFELSCQGQPVFEGTSIFGFFPPEGMVNQAGLDSGQRTLPLLERDETIAGEGSWLDLSQLSGSRPDKPYYHLSHGQVNFVDRIFFAPADPAASGDYLCAVKDNRPDAWFYACHFFQDPVMPGSLGIEAIQQTIQAYILARDLGRHLQSPRFSLPVGQPVSWRYRGQILPTHQQMKLEVKITSVQENAGQVLVEADASLWADTLRIYEVKRAAVSLIEAE
jgi:3-hydroxymyristoyl/3-hydroxydecanoyl-(acyl carrier protein) dehydratase